ncbi:hypothetical protein PsorP6_006478 [Peronosclerospora sorghi]|uniref:Uncharacterized protein n=1 Tax=Peronosclerospora sorghi TaxID=230839 RepID=A0ACC0W244_9STRA|nr:hypothetical protein PsorP6_006478 [Peronosclerospora sorghi]
MHATHVDHPRTKKDTTTKHVRWGAVSVLEFQVWYNASAVPESGGPPLGLIGRPICQRHSMLADVTDSDCESLRSDSDTEVLEARRSRRDLWLDPMDRMRILLQDAAFDMDDIVLICQDVRATLNSRAFSRFEEGKRTSRMLPPPREFGASTRKKVVLY